MTASALLVEPTYFTHPDYHQTFGDEVGELATLAGFPPDPEQQLLLDATFGMDRRGRSVAFEVCAIGARQNIKTGFFKQAGLGKAFIADRKLIVWSAHEFSTTQEAFRDLCVLIESTPTLDRQVKQIHRGNGEEEIELLRGARIKFKARTKSGGKGLSGEDVFLDEAFALQPAHMGSLIPTLSAQPDPQVLYGSSAGYEFSSVLRGIRNRGRAGGDPRLVYAEWCDTGTWEAPPCRDGLKCSHIYGVAEGCALDEPVRWQRANPQMGRRITVDYIEGERRMLPAREFGRERLGWWEEPPEDGADPVVDMAQWAKLADRTATVDGPVALAVAIPRDRSSSTVSVSWLHGERVFSAVTRLPGTSKAVELIRRKLDEHEVLDVSLHAGGPAGALVADLEAEGIEVTTVSTEKLAQATGAYRDGITNSEVGHVDQAELTESLRAARLRNAGDGEMWDQRDELTDIAPVVAATLSTRGFIKNFRGDYDPLSNIF